MKKNSNKVNQATQNFLNIAEIKDDTVVLKDGGVRAVLLVSSVNFALKGQDEQNALIQAYVGFLNSINFPLQIVIQSRNLNIDGYLGKLKNIEKEQTNELLRRQIADYTDFLRELLDLGQIMTKKFFVAVPFSGVSQEKKKFFSQLADALSPARTISLSKKRFENYKDELDKRVDYVASGLSSMSLKTVRLDTQSLIELYYNTYNPELAEVQRLTDVSKVRVDE
ncbi:MAG TPA: hypothetical protein VJB39_00855 [Patescibacteria group bacterium]|nr:hypothetical protein [Patescibacteria group bacterium]